MASKRGSALLIEQAEARVNHLLPALATYLGIDMQPMPTHRDPLQQKVLQTQWFADTLEAIDRAVVEEREGPQEPPAESGDVMTGATQEPATTPAPEGEPGNPDDEEPSDDTTAQDEEQTTSGGASTPPAEGQVQAVDRDALKELKLDELKELAIDAGADAEAVAKMRAKDDVIDAIAGQESDEA